MFSEQNGPSVSPPDVMLISFITTSHHKINSRGSVERVDVYLVADGGAVGHGPEDLGDEGDVVRPGTEGDGQVAALHALTQSPQDELAVVVPVALGQDLYLLGVQGVVVYGAVLPWKGRSRKGTGEGS